MFYFAVVDLTNEIKPSLVLVIFTDFNDCVALWFLNTIRIL